MLLDVKNLTVNFTIKDGMVHAVENVSLQLDEGETLGLVGESGCGKTTLGYAITQLLPDNARIIGGKVMFKGKDILTPSIKKNGSLEGYQAEIRSLRWNEISMIFQGAMNAFNPVYTIGDQIDEAIRIHKDVTKEESLERIKELYDLVGIPSDRINNYPHEYSGGMRQRAMIAMALVHNPSLIIADEPTTALDVIMQRRILSEMNKIQKKFDTAMVIITHDVSVVANTADKIAVMYAGMIMEQGKIGDVFKRTSNPYTEALFAGFPNLRGERKELMSIPGDPPSLVNPPSGCHFHPRCRYAKSICQEQDPPIQQMETGQLSQCHFAKELQAGTLRREVR
ncbi:MAG: ABC transporter ATP-binding protein [Thermoplasmata archaeon]|nr:ABC transporter ATP-binding protein [Thermoplasmata archaeon]